MTRSRAFTLVETIFSTLFISLTVLAIVNLFPGAYLSVRRSETQLQSDIIANSIIEELRAVDPWERSGDPILENKATELAQEITMDGLTYSSTVTIDSVPGTDEKILRYVKVKIEVGLRRSYIKEEHRTEIYETYLHSL